MAKLFKDLDKSVKFRSGHALCPGCPGGTLWQQTIKILGPNIIVSAGATCALLPAANYPPSLYFPTIYIAMAPTAAGLSGISAALRVLRRKGKLKENNGKISVLALSGDGSTADIGFAALSGAAERNDDGIYICFDNEAYMNTGIQRSSQTPYKSWTTSTILGKPQSKKDLPLIMAAHNIPYVATVSVAFPDDYVRKLTKARDIGPGFKYIHAISPCPTGWRFPEEKTMEVSRLAVETGSWLLYEVENGSFRLTYRPVRRKPIGDYLSIQGRFANLTGEEKETIQKSIEQRCRTLGI